MMGRMTAYAQSERAGLCDTFLQVGPDAPTLSGAWRTRDLAAHLVLREHRPDAAMGIFIPPLARRTQRLQDNLAAKDWATLVDKIRSGPPRWSPMSIGRVDEAANLAEFFIHHEDVLRAQPGFTVRSYDDGLQRAIFGLIPRIAVLTTRSARVGLVADCPGFGRRSIHRPKDAHGYVVLTGAPSELLLTIYGRSAVATVEIDGAATDLEEFEPSELGA